MNATTRKVVNVGYGLALTLLAANALLAYYDIRAIVRGNWWVQHTREVVAQLERTASTLKDAETGQRGYLLTGKDEYLKPYVDASGGLDKELDRLVALTADNPDQQARLGELRRIAGEKLAELGQTVALMRKGERDAALAVVQTDRGQALMDRARALVVEMRGEEDRLLTQRSAASSNVVWRAVAAVAIATAIVASGLLLVSHIGRREDAERERVAEAHRQGEEWLTRMMESIGDGVVATDGRGRVRLMNPVAQGLTGWTQAEAVGRPLEEVFVIVNEETRRPAENPVLRAVREGVVMGLANHTVLIARGGAETSIEDSAAPIKDRSGNVVGVVMVFQDATERRRYEAALCESEERHRTILESVTDAFFALDRDWRFTYVNRQAEALLGRTRDDLLGKDIWEEYAPAVGTEFDHAYRRAMDEGVSVAFEAFYTPHDRWYEVHAYPSPDGVAVYFRDVNERKRHEEEHARLTAASEQQRRIYETALSSTPDFTYVFDLEGRFVFANTALLALWRKVPDEALGKRFIELDYPPDLAARLERQILKVIETKQPVLDETPYTSHLGERQYEYIFVPVLGEGGEVEAVAGSTRDITERKRAEEALRERERFIHRILDASPGIVYVFDLEERRTVFINERARGTLGVAPEEVEAAGGRFMAERVHPDDLPGLDDHLGRISLLTDGELLATEYRMRHADGRWLWFSSRDTVFQHAPDGRPRQVLGVASDITDRKEAEERLRDSEGRFRTMAESIPQLAWMARPDGHIYWYNRRWHEYTGTTPEEMEGWGWQRVHDPEVLPGVLERWKGSIASGEPFDMVFPLKGADGHFRSFLTRVAPVRGEDGGIAHWFGTNTDISDRLRIEEELRAAKDEAERANMAKDQFLAVLSHELRTPLNPILLAVSSMLDRPTPTEDVRPTLAMVRQNVNLQARLIDDLLDVMRIVQGKMPLHWGVSDCHEVIRRAVEICQSEVHGKGHRLVLDLSAGEHCVNADSARLQQVFWNLVKNAVKFTPEGGTITIRTRNEDDRDEPIVIEVADTGIGIEPEVIPTIWDPFQQGETTITRRFGGLGLGLAICKGVVEAHGGTLEVESPGKDMGTTFRLVLKTMPAPAESDCDTTDGKAFSPSPTPSLIRLHILLVEDEVATLRLMSRLLTGLGHRVTTAGTVADAWGKFQGGDFDLIISDIGLPDGTGLDLMRKVKALRRVVPAIALTGYGMDEDIRRSREAGFTTHMTKPIDFTKLEAMIRQVAH